MSVNIWKNLTWKLREVHTPFPFLAVSGTPNPSLLLLCTLCCCVSLGSSSLSHYVSTKLIALVCGIHLSYYGDSVTNILSFIHVCV